MTDFTDQRAIPELCTRCRISTWFREALNNSQKFGLLSNYGGGGGPKGVKNKTSYDNFCFAETCYTDSQTSKLYRYDEK